MVAGQRRVVSGLMSRNLGGIGPGGLLRRDTGPDLHQPEVMRITRAGLGLTRGIGPDGCHGLAIRRVVDMALLLRVECLQAAPTPILTCTQAIVSLTDFVVVARSDKRVEFVRSER